MVFLGKMLNAFKRKNKQDEILNLLKLYDQANEKNFKEAQRLVKIENAKANCDCAICSCKLKNNG